ncbi:hypothetical protein FA13DRAFT_1804114 [Coprinellus micaceus]|uniref:CHAT domain-containing protein n=1 Tax=Coprinellus micaceus TaxID=71717 RepID=A0A4Y7S9G0_COPMI|nr:hypothetical protein FA13DRAFT_1804114 [Coprinellus micaceus]
MLVPCVALGWPNAILLHSLQSGDIAAISEAIQLHQKAVSLTPHGHPSLPAHLNGLGLTLRARYAAVGDLSDLSEMISAFQKAVSLSPPNHKDLSGWLKNLGTAFSDRFELTKNAEDISGSISAHQKAVSLFPHGHPDLPRQLASLGSSFLSRFTSTGDPHDIAEAINMGRTAVKLAPEDSSDFQSNLQAFATSLIVLSKSSGYLDDVTEAIEIQRKLIKVTPEASAALPDRLARLGDSICGRFEITNDSKELDEAIACIRRAVNLTPESHRTFCGRLHNLAMSLLLRFQVHRELQDLREAIEGFKHVVKLMPEGYSQLSRAHGNLGIALQMRYGLRHDPADIDASIAHYKLAASCEVGDLTLRLSAARSWGSLSNAHTSSFVEAIIAFDLAIDIVTLMAGLDKAVQHRHALLKGVSGVPLEAAAIACQRDCLSKAVEWLEHGRCLVWSQLHDLRTPLGELYVYNSALAQAIADASKELENAASSPPRLGSTVPISDKMEVEKEGRARLQLSKKRDDLLKAARAIQGFENFLQPLPFADLLEQLPTSGPVVIINVERKRCDAIAMLSGSEEPLHIHLPNFSKEKAERYCKQLRQRLAQRGLRSRDEEEEVGCGWRVVGPYRREKLGGKSIVHIVLHSLWTEVVKPILEALAFPRVGKLSERILPRIWWCPTGALSFLPLHAAGRYDDSDSDSILDYAVSSYTPTISSLTERVKMPHLVNPEVAGLFLTSQPNARGLPSIPGTIREVNEVHARASEKGIRVSKVEGNALSVSDCLKHMEEFSCIHLACHASQYTEEPIRSQFRFHTGSLELDTVMRRNLKNADLAFLSACETSTGEDQLSEEAVHLAAGMLAAGYRRVVATMWAIGDRHAPDLANDFYQYLWDHQEDATGTCFDGSLSAHALHHATQRLRDRLDDAGLDKEKALLAWVPYVHYGF